MVIINNNNNNGTDNIPQLEPVNSKERDVFSNIENWGNEKKRIVFVYLSLLMPWSGFSEFYVGRFKRGIFFLFCTLISLAAITILCAAHISQYQFSPSCIRILIFVSFTVVIPIIYGLVTAVKWLFSSDKEFYKTFPPSIN